MTIENLLKKRNMTKYRLAVDAGIPHATLNDICSGKTRLEKCSAETVYKLAKALGVSAADLDASDTEEEIKQLLDAGGDNGSLQEAEMEMIQNIFEFKDTLAGDICTHRTDIAAIPLDASLKDVTQVINDEIQLKREEFGLNS